MAIAKTASRNIALKVAKKKVLEVSKTVFQTQVASSFRHTCSGRRSFVFLVFRESLERESLEDLGLKAGLWLVLLVLVHTHTVRTYVQYVRIHTSLIMRSCRIIL